MHGDRGDRVVIIAASRLADDMSKVKSAFSVVALAWNDRNEAQIKPRPLRRREISGQRRRPYRFQNCASSRPDKLTAVRGVDVWSARRQSALRVEMRGLSCLYSFTFALSPMSSLAPVTAANTMLVVATILPGLSQSSAWLGVTVMSRISGSLASSHQA